MAGIFNFVISMTDKVSPEAKKTAAQIDSLSAEIRTNRDKVLGLNLALREQAAAYRAIENPTKRQAFEQRNLMGGMRDHKANLLATNQKLYMQRAALEDQAKASLLSQGATEGASSSLMSMGGALAGVAVAAAAAVVAIAAVAYKGAELALEASEAKEKMTTLFDAMGEGQTSGKQVMTMLGDLRGSLGMTREEMAPLAKSFMAMGIRDIPALKSAMTAAASASAMMGEEGANAFKSMMGRIEEAKEASGNMLKINVGKKNPFAAMGVDIADVSREMGVSSAQLSAMLKNGTAKADVFGKALESAITAKGKGPLERMSSSFGATFKTMKESMVEMFADVDVKPFLEAFKHFAGIFDKNTATGKLFKMVISGAFTAIFAAAKPVIRFIEKALLGFVILGLKAYIGLKHIWKAFQEFDAGKVVGDIVDGLVNGLVAGKDRVVDAMKGMASGALKAFTGIFQVASPSRVMMKIGGHVAEGFTQGYEAESDRAGSMGPANFQPDAFKPANGNAAPAASGGKTSIAVTMNVQLSGSSPSAVAQELTEEAVSLVFERMALAQGL